MISPGTNASFKAVGQTQAELYIINVKTLDIRIIPSIQSHSYIYTNLWSRG